MQALKCSDKHTAINQLEKKLDIPDTIEDEETRTQEVRVNNDVTSP